MKLHSTIIAADKIQDYEDPKPLLPFEVLRQADSLLRCWARTYTELPLLLFPLLPNSLPSPSRGQPFTLASEKSCSSGSFKAWSPVWVLTCSRSSCVTATVWWYLFPWSALKPPNSIQDCFSFFPKLQRFKETIHLHFNKTEQTTRSTNHTIKHV